MHSQLVETESRKCHPESDLALIKSNHILVCEVPPLQANLHQNFRTGGAQEVR